MDGIAMGPQITHILPPPQASNTPLLDGSTYAMRVGVPSASGRKLLRKFSTSTGLTPAEKLKLMESHHLVSEINTIVMSCVILHISEINDIRNMNGVYLN